MSRIASDEALSSHSSIGRDDESVISASEDDRASASERRRPGTGRSSIHTASALAVVDQARSRPQSVRIVLPSSTPSYYQEEPLSSARPLRRESRRSLQPRPPSASTLRPVTAPATATALSDVVPSNSDRLKNLQLHMEQLQQLYAQEIHKEELASREAFVQSMCTSSITLWRYVTSRARFYTAVKALVTQYLPATNARLYQVEETAGSVDDSENPSLSLVLADSRVVAVDKEGTEMGIVGHAVLAMSQLTSSQFKELQETSRIADVDQGGVDQGHADAESVVSSSSSSLRSSRSSSASSSFTSGWLSRHADCVMPSTTGHLVLLLSLDRAYRDAGFHAAVDLTIKKKDLLGGKAIQLLIIVLRDSHGRPVGAIEALVSAKNPVKLDFLDAFSSLLAAALEARRTICRPVTGDGISIHIVHDESEERVDDAGGESSVVIEIAPQTKMVVVGMGGGPHSSNAAPNENDQPLLEAVQTTMKQLYSEKQQWETRARGYDQCYRAEQALYAEVVEMIVKTTATAQASHDHQDGPQTVRPVLQDALRGSLHRLAGSLEGAVSVRILFDDETLQVFTDLYSSHDVPDGTVSVNDQYGMLHKELIHTGGESIEPSKDAFSAVLPVELTMDTKQRKASVLLLFHTVENEFLVSHLNTHTLQVVGTCVQLVLWGIHILEEHNASKTQEIALREQLHLQHQAAHERDAIIRLSHRLAACKSLTEVVATVNRVSCWSSMDEAGLGPLQTVIVSIAEYAEDSEEATPRLIWTMVGEDRVILFDQQSGVSSPRRQAGPRGMARFVLVDAREPVVYTHHHTAYDATWRPQQPLEKQQNEPAFYYYAMPLQSADSSASSLGVVEVSFATQDQQIAFVGSPYQVALVTTVSGFLSHHLWLTQREKALSQDQNAVIERGMAQWEAWTEFVATWGGWSCAEDEEDPFSLESWRDEMVTGLQRLLPHASSIHLLLTGDAITGGSDGVDDAALMGRVECELEKSHGRASLSLNAYTQSLLQSIVVFPIAMTRSEHAEPSRAGLLVVTTTSAADTIDDGDGEDAAFHDEASRFGPLVVQLLSTQLSDLQSKMSDRKGQNTLMASLALCESQLKVTQEERVRVVTRAWQQSVLLRVNRAIQSPMAWTLWEDLMPVILDEVSSGLLQLETADHGHSPPQPHQGRKDAPVLLYVFLRDGKSSTNTDNDWSVWSSSTPKERLVLSSADVDGVVQPVGHLQDVRDYKAPFVGPHEILIRKLVQQEDFEVDGVHMATTALLPCGVDISAFCVVLWWPQQQKQTEGEGVHRVDERFLHELMDTVRDAITWQSCYRERRDLEATLATMTTDHQQTEGKLKVATDGHKQWAATSANVLEKLWTQRSHDSQDVWTTTSLLRDIEAAVHKQLIERVFGGDCSDCVVDSVHISTWSPQQSPVDHSVLGVDVHSMQWTAIANKEDGFPPGWVVECAGGVASGAVATRWKRQTHNGQEEQGNSVVVVGFHLHGGSDKCVEVEAKLMKMAVRVVELVATVQQVGALHQRIQEDTIRLAAQRLLIDQQNTKLDEWTTHANRRGNLDTGLMKLLLLDKEPLDAGVDGSGFVSSVLDAVMELRGGYRLWIVHTQASTLWTMQQDGVKQVKPIKMLPLASCSDSLEVAIHVDGECVALMERDASDCDVRDPQQDELSLVASVVQCCFTHRHLQQALHQQRELAVAKSIAEDEWKTRDEQQHTEIGNHWHRVSAILGVATPSDDDWLTVQASFGERLGRIENDVAHTMKDVVATAVRVAVITIDVDQHRVMDVVDAQSPSPHTEGEAVYSRVLSTLQLWTASALEPASVKTLLCGPLSEDANGPLHQIVDDLFPSESRRLPADANFFLLSVPVFSVASATAFTLVMALATTEDEAAMRRLQRALEVDAQLVATAFESWRLCQAIQRRVVDADQHVQAAECERETAQQWTTFSQRTLDQASQLVSWMLHEMMVQTDGPVGGLSAVVEKKIEQFVQATCGCDSVTLYSVVDDTYSQDQGTALNRRRCRFVPLVAAQQEKVPTVPESLEKLMDQSIVDLSTCIVVQDHTSGSRVVASLTHGEDNDHHHQRQAIGAAVFQWGPSSDHQQPSDATLEVVDSIVRPWLSMALSLYYNHQRQRAALETLRQEKESLANDKNSLELEGLDLKHHAMRSEQRHMDFQHELELSRGLLTRVVAFVLTATEVGQKEPADVWAVLTREISEMHSVQGVQRYEKRDDSDEGHSVRRVASTLTAAEDEILQLTIQTQAKTKAKTSSGDVVGLCLESGGIHEFHVAFSASDVKRVRVVGLTKGHSCLLTVYTRDDSHHQAVLVDRCVNLLVQIATNRVVQLERVQCQEIALHAVEESIQELSTQRDQMACEFAKTHQKSDMAMALHHTLSHDLVSHSVWRKTKHFERPVSSASASTIPTATLVGMWRFLVDVADKRLQRACQAFDSGAAASGLRVQVYGVVQRSDSTGATGGDASFAFSLPSSETSGAAAKGFYCVDLKQLQTGRREWRTMAKCIRRTTSISNSTTGTAKGQPTVTWFFPMIMTVDGNQCGDREDAEERDSVDEETEMKQTSRGRVVGVAALTLNGTGPLAEALATGETKQLVQGFVDALAFRVDWIARVVAKKQQQRESKRLPQPQPLTWTQRQPRPPNQDSDTAVTHGSDSGSRDGEQLLAGLSMPSTPWHPQEGERTALLAPEVSYSCPTELTAMRSDPEGNQFQHGDHEEPSEVDSDEERQAERVRDRVRAMVAQGVFEFACQVQSLPSVVDHQQSEQEDEVAVLRSLVSRTLPHVWTKHGDIRKNHLDSCELWLLVDGSALNRLDSMDHKQPPSPSWLGDFSTRFFQQAKQTKTTHDAYRLWKLDATRWVVTAAIESHSQSLMVAVVLTGSHLPHIFDGVDDRVHLPALARVLQIHVTHLWTAHWKRLDAANATRSEQDTKAQALAVENRQQQEMARRQSRDAELGALTLKLFQARDTRELVQLALATLRDWLQCGHVAFHAASPVNATATARTTAKIGRPLHGEPVEWKSDNVDGRVVAIETVVRVQVVAPDKEAGVDHNYDQEPSPPSRLLGTLIARLSDVERVALEDSLLAVDGGHAWLKASLHGLAKAVATSWIHHEQRKRLAQTTHELQGATTEMETMRQQLHDVKAANDELCGRVDALAVDADQQQAVDEHNQRLRLELEQLRETVEASETARLSMATQLQQYKTQLIHVNCQLEQSIRTESQLLRLEETHAATQARETRLSKKLLKQNLQLDQMGEELKSRRAKDERDQAELIELRRQVAVLMEKQQQIGGSGGAGSLDVASVVMQAAQVQVQAQQQQQQQLQMQLHNQAAVAQQKLEDDQEQQRQQQQQQKQRAALHTAAVQRTFLRQLQLQQQMQTKKQLELAEELKQLAAMEVHEMKRRKLEMRAERNKTKRLQSKQAASTDTVDLAKVFPVMKANAASTLDRGVSSGTTTATTMTPLWTVAGDRDDRMSMRAQPRSGV